MDLFSEFSFAAPASRRNLLHAPEFDMEEISPSSTRSSSPAPQVGPKELTMGDLTVQFDRHNIAPSPLPSVPRSHPATHRRISSATSSTSSSMCFGPLSPGSTSDSSYSTYDNVRRVRQSGARSLCTKSRMASIETLVDRMLRDGSSCYASLHPSSSGSLSCRKRSVTSAPVQSPTSGCESEDGVDGYFDLLDDVAQLGAVPTTRMGEGVASIRRSAIEKSRGGRRKAISRR